ncbi:SA1362 family protein [Bacillus sp. FJAT-50079]|uniref:SA1362 family protein n=1 Tax=Bacillus sp. FJAT-50079 TaxID=2833577 RepID=UPI001BC99256|nr:SA1362 family protein [Bacillus sp. FJAT-50079]MBS4209626.1 hypothetical protein [Bacillus sp. FJAT-50079]
MNVRNWFFIGILVFAAIGLGSSLFTNPLGLMKQVIFIIVVAAAIFGVYRFLSGRRPGAGEYRSFAKAAKQSKKRMKHRQTPSKQSSSAKVKPLRKRSAAHLTVIEGKKGKKKDRAIF